MAPVPNWEGALQSSGFRCLAGCTGDILHCAETYNFWFPHHFLAVEVENIIISGTNKSVVKSGDVGRFADCRSRILIGVEGAPLAVTDDYPVCILSVNGCSQVKIIDPAQHIVRNS